MWQFSKFVVNNLMDNLKIDQQPTLIVVHIPKTAGTTLNHILRRYYHPSAIVDIYDHEWDSANVLKKLFSQNETPIRVIRGHLRFGIHNLINSPSTYITMLRNPIDRIMSHYYHVLREETHPMHKEIVSRNLTIEEYVRCGVILDIDNGQTRQIAGLPQPAIGQCTGELLQRAKAHIDTHFTMVGITERFPESLFCMKVLLGWRSWPFYSKHNIGQDKPIYQCLSRKTRDIIEKHNPFDCELYEYAKKRFEEKILRDCFPQRLQVPFFKIANSIYGKWRNS